MRLISLFFAILTASISLSACSQQQAKESAPLTASAPAGSASSLTERNAQQRLKTTLEQHFTTAGLKVKITDLQKVENSLFYWVRLDNHTSVFTTDDGQYVFQGDLIKMGSKNLESVSDKFQSHINKELLATLKADDLIIYPATRQKIHTIYVFSDISCSYCQRLHKQMNEMNAKGIEVRYIAWPRGEELFPAMESIWCSADRKKAFDDAIAGTTLPPATCKNPVRSQFELGQQMGVAGTPAIFTEAGRQIGGYLSVNDLEKALINNQ